jgi:aldehyde dehydrogenase (NAD+)
VAEPSCLVGSTLTPLTAFELSRAVDAAGFPPGVFNLVTGAGSDIGQRLCGHPLIDHVSFTGSPAVGRQVAAAAAGMAKSLTLEVGGKSASIVLSDVSDELLAKAVKDTVANCFLNCGQTSAALSRLIVPRVRQAQVEEWAAAEAARYVPGRGLGPLISAGHRFAVEGYLEPSLAKVITGTVDLPAIGYYVTPTVYSDVDPASDLAQDEVFGPVLSILTAESDDHAIQLVNDSNYGLGGALWIEDAQRALDWAARIRAGQVAVNAAPFGPGALIGGYTPHRPTVLAGDGVARCRQWQAGTGRRAD